ncbi:MAG TPA: universal stress protein [Solirubrobacteraceae bacterium]|nr:universal stress protein [Solirubrobacteraceae bacterium]
MTEALLIVFGLAVGVAVTLLVRRRGGEEPDRSGRRILFPYVGSQLSTSALDAALRIARVEEATLVPAYLAPVPMALPLETPIARSCSQAFELQEAIEQRAAPAGVPVDGRIGRGRTVQHALRQLLDDERYDRIVVAAATANTDGLSAREVAWLLEHAPGEVVVLRPADEAALAAA